LTGIVVIINSSVVVVVGHSLVLPMSAWAKHTHRERIGARGAPLAVWMRQDGLANAQPLLLRSRAFIKGAIMAAGCMIIVILFYLALVVRVHFLGYPA
jgi:hypothetical protein